MKSKKARIWAAIRHGNPYAGGCVQVARTGCTGPSQIPGRARDVAGRCRRTAGGKLALWWLASVMLLTSSISANAFCEPPFTPPPTSAEAARAYAAEFRMEFETYFRDAQDWFLCVEQQKQAVRGEVDDTARRYQRFMQDSAKWESQ